MSRSITASVDLDDRRARTDVIAGTLRYVLFPMIAETARHAGHAGHAGHADILRESLDGSRGP